MTIVMRLPLTRQGQTQTQREGGNRAITTASQDGNTPAAAVCKMRGLSPAKLPDNCTLQGAPEEYTKDSLWKSAQE